MNQLIDNLEIFKNELSKINESENLFLLTDPEGKIILYNILFSQLCNVANKDNLLFKNQSYISDFFISQENSLENILLKVRSDFIWNGYFTYQLTFEKSIRLKTSSYLIKFSTGSEHILFIISLGNFDSILEDELGESAFKSSDLSPIFVGFNATDTFTSNEERENFIATISHEFRTPLTSIIGFAETIRYDSAMDVNLKNEFLDIILLEARKLTKIINDMIDLLVFEKGTINFLRSNESINLILRSNYSKFLPLAQNKNIQFSLDLPQNDVICNINVDKINQLIMNLLDNAVKFTPENGQIFIKLSENQNECTVEIKDTGRGIPENKLKNVFKRFYKIDKSNFKLNQTELGIGLTISERIAKIHNGKLLVESQENVGTKFTLVLPKNGN